MDKDLVKKECLSDDERYADLLNGLLFYGEQKVQAADLQEMDSQLSLSMWLRKKTNRYRQLYRDMIRRTAFGVNFALIGIENQELVHYLMPLRTMEYDAAEYEKQAAGIRKRVKKMKGISNAEFISGFRKTDRLYPCVTLVLYYGEDWDGARSLHDVIDFSDIPDGLKKYVNDYPIHIFEVLKMENTEVFRTDLKQIFDFLRYSKDKAGLRELVENDKAYQEMAEDAYDMIAVCTNEERLISVKKYHGEDGKVNMCQAIREMLADERLIGLEEGIEKGIEKGIERGIEAFVQDNIEEGVAESRIVNKLVVRFQLSDEKAQDYVRKYR